MNLPLPPSLLHPGATPTPGRGGKGRALPPPPPVRAVLLGMALPLLSPPPAPASCPHFWGLRPLRPPEPGVKSKPGLVGRAFQSGSCRRRKVGRQAGSGGSREDRALERCSGADPVLSAGRAHWGLLSPTRSPWAPGLARFRELGARFRYPPRESWGPAGLASLLVRLDQRADRTANGGERVASHQPNRRPPTSGGQDRIGGHS